MIHQLSSKLWFPSVSQANEDGLLAVGGDLSLKRLLLAYQTGIFPWYEEGQPILWWSPNPRMVLFPERFKISKSLKKTIKSGKFSVTFNQNFQQVIRQCATIKRNRQAGTWITPAMQQAYTSLFEKGHILSVEVWKDNLLVGGLYGINLANVGVYCGESMFSTMSDASKVGLFFLVEKLKKEHYKLIDCQVYTSHLASLGAEEIPRSTFLKYLKNNK